MLESRGYLASRGGGWGGVDRILHALPLDCPGRWASERTALCCSAALLSVPLFCFSFFSLLLSFFFVLPSPVEK